MGEGWHFVVDDEEGDEDPEQPQEPLASVIVTTSSFASRGRVYIIDERQKRDKA